MPLFDVAPIDPVRHGTSSSVTYKDRKGRATRRRPYWIDLGRGPVGATCKTCYYLVRTEYAKVYFKCGTWPITAGPGTQIAMKDPACLRYQRKGLPMFSIKQDRER